MKYRKNTITFLFSIFAFGAFAQRTQPYGVASAHIDVTNINATILTGGDMFHNLTPTGSSPNFSQSFEVPRGSGIHSIFAGSLWIGGRDNANNLYVSAQTYRQGAPQDVGFWPGPIANVHDQ